MAHLIDSSVVITLERRGLRPSALEAAAANEPVAIASITASELLVGVYRAQIPERRSQREAFVEAVFSAFPILPFDLPIARLHARLGAELMVAGQPIGAHDLLIAATALTYGYAVLTENLRDFRRVPGLVVRQPNW